MRLVDLDGDGYSDVLRSGSRLECFFNDPDRRQAWKRTDFAPRQSLKDFPNVNFSDPRVRLADMNGDGLQDIVLIHDGNVEYWPNLGHNRWGKRLSNERPFSFRFQFADAWYDLNNSHLLEADQQMRVTFETRHSNFPPNVTDLKIAHVSLYFVRKEGFTQTIKVDHLLFTEAGRAGTVGGAANTNNGRISTRDANAGSWLAIQGRQPIGEWELKLPNEDVVKKWFKDEMIEDILFVITYGGTTAAWPG